MLLILTLLAIGYALFAYVLWRSRINERRYRAELRASANLHEALAQKYHADLTPAEVEELQRARWN